MNARVPHVHMHTHCPCRRFSRAFQMETYTVANLLAAQFNEHAAQLLPGAVPEVVYAPCELACIPQAYGMKFYIMVCDYYLRRSCTANRYWEHQLHKAS